MGNAIAVYESSGDIAINRVPEEVLEEAKKAAKALGDVVRNKKKPVIMNGEQYLEFEDWQTVGRFYGVTAKIISTDFIQYGEVQGFEAKAVAIRPDGMEVSAAEAMCLNDEPNWKSKPLFQLRSMAQTRACAKALRNCLAWVVVLAGYRPTPAEEIQDMAQQKSDIKPPQGKSDTPPSETTGEPLISAAQGGRFYAIAKGSGYSDEEIHAWLIESYGIESTKDIPKSKYDEMCKIMGIKKDA